MLIMVTTDCGKGVYLPVKTNSRCELSLRSHCQAHQRTTLQASSFIIFVIVIIIIFVITIVITEGQGGQLTSSSCRGLLILPETAPYQSTYSKCSSKRRKIFCQ